MRGNNMEQTLTLMEMGLKWKLVYRMLDDGLKITIEKGKIKVGDNYSTFDLSDPDEVLNVALEMLAISKAIKGKI
jgi:hypothetical protein